MPKIRIEYVCALTYCWEVILFPHSKNLGGDVPRPLFKMGGVKFNAWDALQRRWKYQQKPRNFQHCPETLISTQKGHCLNILPFATYYSWWRGKVSLSIFSLIMPCCSSSLICYLSVYLQSGRLNQCRIHLLINISVCFWLTEYGERNEQEESHRSLIYRINCTCS